MKKNLFFAAMAVAALASCSNDEVVEVNRGEGIAFRTSLDKPVSRGTLVTTNSLTEFKATAIGNGATYFDNQTVKRGTGDQSNYWFPEQTYYWPGYELAFFAYAPVTPGGTVGIANDAKKITDFTPEQEVANQKDLIVAYNKGTRAANEGSGVALNFKHALSQIEVQAKNSGSNIKIEVLGVKLAGSKSKANFNFPEAATTTAYVLPQSQWANWSEEKAYMVKRDAAVTLTAQAQSVMPTTGGNFLLIPQQLTAWDGTTATTGAYLSVLCRIYNVSGTNETLIYPELTATDAKDGKYGFAAVAIDTNWEPGKKYTYVLDFCAPNGGGAGKIDPNPTNPSQENDENIDPTPKPGKEGGDPVLGGPIKFTMTVDDWVDQTPATVVTM